MDGLKSLFLSLLLSILLSVGATYVFVPFFSPPSLDGSLNQSPLFYVGVILGIIIIGSVLYFFNSKSSGKGFDFWLFICVAFAGLMVGGVIHEFTHIILIQHPTQFRVHFGDSNAIFSTCCVSPGENQYELLAYLIQFLITIGWILAFRGQYDDSGKKEKREKKNRVTRPKEKEDEKSSVDEDEDPEWVRARKEIDQLVVKRKKGKADSNIMSEWGDLRRLKVPKRD